MPPPRPPDECDTDHWDDEHAADDWDADPDAPQESDLDDEDDDTPTVPCPNCGQPVADFAERCPHCDDWIIPGDRPTRGPRWIVVAAILAVAALLVWQLW